MGVDIGVCKYIPEREQEIVRLGIMSTLVGEEGKRYAEELHKIHDEISKECDEIYELHKENFGLILARMFNLWFEVRLNTGNYEFSFYQKYRTARIPPATIKCIIEDMEKLLPISNMKEHMEHMLKFFRFIVENNYMIYPA